VHDGVVDPLPQTVGSGARPQPAPKETPQALLDADVAATAVARVEMCAEFVGLNLTDGAIEIEINEMLNVATEHRWLLSNSY
jgi:hypothetical protein